MRFTQFNAEKHAAKIEEYLLPFVIAHYNQQRAVIIDTITNDEWREQSLLGLGNERYHLTRSVKLFCVIVQSRATEKTHYKVERETDEDTGNQFIRIIESVEHDLVEQLRLIEHEDIESFGEAMMAIGMIKAMAIIARDAAKAFYRDRNTK